MNTKVFVAMVALVLLAATTVPPALAQRAAPSRAGASTGDSFSQSRRLHSGNPSNDVFVNGQYVGSDPDPNIRAQLQRNYGNQGRW